MEHALFYTKEHGAGHQIAKEAQNRQMIMCKVHEVNGLKVSSEKNKCLPVQSSLTIMKSRL